MNDYSWLLLLSLWVCISCNQAQQGDSQVEEEIKATLTQMWAAIEAEDIDTYASFIHPDFTQFGEYDSVLKRGKEVELLGVRNWVETADNIHTEMEEPVVSIRGNTAWITYYWMDSGMNGETPFASRGKSTRIFVKENEKWLCIHGHYTLLPKRKTQMSTTELALHDLREQSNAALQKGEIGEISKFWTEDILITTGNGTLLTGKSAIKKFLQQVYQQYPNVVYERTPMEIEINSSKGLAWEKGSWIGFNRGKKEDRIAHGKYSAMWTRQGDTWKIKSQLFVEL